MLVEPALDHREVGQRQPAAHVMVSHWVHRTVTTTSWPQATDDARPRRLVRPSSRGRADWDGERDDGGEGSAVESRATNAASALPRATRNRAVRHAGPAGRPAGCRQARRRADERGHERARRWQRAAVADHTDRTTDTPTGGEEQGILTARATNARRRASSAAAGTPAAAVARTRQCRRQAVRHRGRGGGRHHAAGQGGVRGVPADAPFASRRAGRPAASPAAIGERPLRGLVVSNGRPAL
jgi:hypothetical protein